MMTVGSDQLKLIFEQFINLVPSVISQKDTKESI